MGESNTPFPIVGLGASAGGLTAFTEFLRALPADTGMGFVLVQHLSPTHPSALAEILGRATPMPVVEVEGEMPVAPNHVYVIPPGQSMVIAEGVLQLHPRGTEAVHHPVDQFFRSLAEDRRHRAMGVVLSGTATDGTAGLIAIKGESGITFAQDASAQHDGMPQSAIATGAVDFVLAPADIAREIARIGRGAGVGTPALPGGEDPQLARVIDLLHHATDIDYRGYKPSTLGRRVRRRMILGKLEELPEYVRFLESTPAELEALSSDLLIGVTQFFRNPDAFDALQRDVFPALLANRAVRDPVRIWCIGCSSGEEAYSLAMAYTEVAEERGSRVPLQLFATDLSARVVDKARAGVFPKEIAQDVSPDRLRRFFSGVEEGYRINKSIRACCVFSRHNVLSDPPFSRMDLISCRNLLIYLEPALQQRVMATLHYALRPKGRLFLGNSETIGTHRRLFAPSDAKQRIYARQDSLPGERGGFPMAAQARQAPFAPFAARPESGTDLPREADRVLSGAFAPPGILVTPELEIVQYRGDTAQFLTPSPGKASLNLLKMLREGLVIPVRQLLTQAQETGTTARQEGVRVKVGRGHAEVTLEAIPIPQRGGGRAGYLVLFHSLAPEDQPRRPSKKPGKKASVAPPADPAPEVTRLEQELTATREYMQSVIEQQEAANEELQSANEEVQSANEELQSLNEELETSKEEIQSSNEELATVNDELNNRNTELGQLNTDLHNLLANIPTGIIMLGPDLRIRRFNAAAAKQLGLIAGDLGRPFRDIRLHFVPGFDLEALLGEVLETVQPREREVHDLKGRWYSIRLRPYRTPEHKIDGVVVMLIDIDALKRSQQLTANIVDTVREPVLVLDAGLRVRIASASFYYRFKVTPEETEGRRVYRLGDGQWDIPELRRLLAEVLLKDGVIRDYMVEHNFEHIGRRTMLINARRLHQPEDAEPLILLAIEDDTDKRAAREALQHFRLLFEAAPGAYLVLEPERYAIAAVSDAFLQATHTRREEITGRSLFEVFPDDPAAERPDGVKNLSASLARVKETRRSDVMAPQLYPMRAADGGGFEERWWSPVNSPVLGPHGEVAYIIHRVEDITPYVKARREEGTLAHGMELLETRAQQLEADIVLRSQELRRANEELKASTEQYRSLVNQIEDYAIFRTDVSGLATTWNEGVRRVLGLEEAEFVGVDVSGRIYTPEDQASGAPLRELADAAAVGKTSNDRWMLRKDGGRFYCVGLTISHRDAQGRLTGFTKVMRDETDRKELEDELHRRNAEMTEADRHKNEFLAMLAHELRNPLAPMANAVQLLRGPNLDQASARLATEMMGRQVTQMTRLVDDLLDVHRISRGTIQLRKSAIELNRVVEQAVEALGPQIEARKQVLTLRVPDRAIPLYGDPTRLAQVVGNLLGNASKFSPEGSEIGLEVGVSDGHAELTVRDRGIGIPPEETRRIFELFAQADPPAGRARGGIGVGLTLVKELVEMHEGTVEARSDGPGTGSEFVVRLPLPP